MVFLEVYFPSKMPFFFLVEAQFRLDVVLAAWWLF